MNTFDTKRAILHEKDLFPRFKVKNHNDKLEELLKNKNIKPNDELLVIERNGQKLAFPIAQIAYHHVAQGELSGEPYLVTFCGICHSGAGMVPVIDGKTYHFAARGMYNGTVLLGDDETHSFWDHMTGKCVHGSLLDKQMDVFPIHHFIVEDALKKWPDIQIALSKPLKRTIFKRTFIWLILKMGFFPRHFRRTMEAPDERLPKMTSGLGVIIDGEAKFYSVSSVKKHKIIQDSISGHSIVIKFNSERFPMATFDGMEHNRPLMQIYSKWYGFSLTYPKCAIYKE
ncbi:DUF3179 domain-containing (seleno)protein [Chengkuizengella axinellae]|uniref:DUF3179 domain-containing (Seleno)protein n=1 Tax=Chengkuizengella axinellae TaxID=3064388 RepID=A0ABT9J204_9BACL|nr:DUF3179 domain-containing (seleno)protein [Chengkuizengella sp. 2205SS18-9]MDP5275636.1 DUF3179 domain-containing (seleno)protein [Chengkuizengella sp. 2205SS18-9]